MLSLLPLLHLELFRLTYSINAACAVDDQPQRVGDEKHFNDEKWKTKTLSQWRSPLDAGTLHVNNAQN